MARPLLGGITAAATILGGVTAGALALARLAPASTDGGPAPTPTAATELLPPSGIPQCDEYRALPDAYGFCIYKFAGGFPKVEDVERLCPMAGPWEAECRHAWVAGRMDEASGHTTEALLKVCGTNADCAFELLDFRPSPVIDVQLDRCRLYAMKHAPDCTGHAMQRWWMTGPDAAEVARVAALPTAFPRKVGFYIAVSAQCDGVGTCEGAAAVQQACEGQARSFARKPENCPRKTKTPLNPGGKGPEGEATSLGTGVPTAPGTPAPGRPPGTPPAGSPARQPGTFGASPGGQPAQPAGPGAPGGQAHPPAGTPHQPGTIQPGPRPGKR